MSSPEDYVIKHVKVPRSQEADFEGAIRLFPGMLELVEGEFQLERTEQDPVWKHELDVFRGYIGGVRSCEDLRGFKRLSSTIGRLSPNYQLPYFPKSPEELKRRFLEVCDITHEEYSKYLERPGYYMRTKKGGRPFVYKHLGSKTVSPKYLRLATNLFSLDGREMSQAEALRAEANSKIVPVDIHLKIAKDLGRAIAQVAKPNEEWDPETYAQGDSL